MKRIAYLVSFLVLVAAATAITATTPAQLDVEAYSVNVSIQPSSRDKIQLLGRQSPYSYTCEVSVFDAIKKTPIVGPITVVVGRGDTGSAHVERKAWVTTVTVKLGAKAERADVEVLVKKDGKIATRQYTTVMLNNADPGIVPVQ